MQMVLLTALGIGGATVIGAVIGFCFKKISHNMNDIILAFAAGVMLAAAVIGLICRRWNTKENIRCWSVLQEFSVEHYVLTL